jgi:hypothetical protein
MHGMQSQLFVWSVRCYSSAARGWQTPQFLRNMAATPPAISVWVAVWSSKSHLAQVLLVVQQHRFESNVDFPASNGTGVPAQII